MPSEQVPSPNTTANPGELVFTLKIVENYSEAQDICDISKENVLEIEVVEILERGSGIIHTPHPKDILLVSFLLSTEELAAGQDLEVTAKEFLCLDNSASYFVVISHKVLE